jgi:VIT1/CCC1 family predicted Fe2+/Mn2+ transporter
MKNLKESVKVGLTFGLTSGVITTLGLMVGLNSGTNLKLAVIAGILTIAVADAFSDALGIHVSQESTNTNSSKEVWTATFATFIFKFIFALTFIIPVLIFNLNTAVIVSIIWGMLLLGVASYFIAKETNQKPLHVIFEHVLISVIVIVIANYLGVLINNTFLK